MGRLSPEKGFDRLIDAFSRVAGGRGEWSLVIAGEGPERGALEAAAREKGVADRVHMPGAVKNTRAVFEACDLFAMSSRYEGFPVSLCQAMAGGLPAVCFDCDTGPRDIIRDGVDGILVSQGDVAALAAALDRLMGDEGLRGRMGEEARKVTERFSTGRVMALWEDLLKKSARR